VASEAATDAALLEAARNGDVASYGQLVERYEAVAHRTAFALGAGDDTADVVQEAFVKAFLALGRFRVSEPFRPWLLKIVVNETRNRWRWYSRHRTVPLPLVAQEPASPVRTPELVAEENEKIRSLRDALAALPRHQRDVVTCRYLLDLTEHETAQVLRIPNGTVKSRLSRGLAALQATLRPTIAPEVVEAERRGV
jgi:RNA polymerase sigma-70 factor (ECF subfamily)